MRKRLRLVGVVLTPQFMVDDGDNIIPLSVDPITVPAAQWPNVVEGFAQAVAALREQVEGPPPVTD